MQITNQKEEWKKSAIYDGHQNKDLAINLTSYVKTIFEKDFKIL